MATRPSAPAPSKGLPQGMFETNFAGYKGHSSSDHQRLADAYPGSPIHSGVGEAETPLAEFNRNTVKIFYEYDVCKGTQHADNAFPPDSDFSQAPSPDHESNLVFSGAPSIPDDVQPADEGEAGPGDDGSTIAAGGKGPNAATLDINNATNPADGRSNVDASTPSVPPFRGVLLDPATLSTAAANAFDVLPGVRLPGFEP